VRLRAARAGVEELCRETCDQDGPQGCRAQARLLAAFSTGAVPGTHARPALA